MALAGSDEEEKLDFLEKRLSNCEFIIVGLWVAARDALPSDTQEDIDKMLTQYFNAGRSYGGFSDEQGDSGGCCETGCES